MEAQQQPQPQQQKQVALSEVEIKDENVALNVMVAMLNMAQKRGTFSMEESSKCWECIQKFVRPQQTPCILYTSQSPRDQRGSRMPSSD